MPALKKENLEKYFSALYNGEVRITSISEIGRAETEDLKGFGYGVPYIIRFSVNNAVKSVVLETMSPNSFGHDHFLTGLRTYYGTILHSTVCHGMYGL